MTGHPHGPTGLTDSRCLSCKDGACIVHARTVTVWPGDPGYDRAGRAGRRAARRALRRDQRR